MADSRSQREDKKKAFRAIASICALPSALCDLRSAPRLELQRVVQQVIDRDPAVGGTGAWLVEAWWLLNTRELLATQSLIQSRVIVLSDAQLDQKLKDAQRRLQCAFGPCSIYLYGSYAAGTPKVDSDIDLAVVVPASNLDFHSRCVRARLALAGFGHPLDVMVYTAEEFEERAGWFASIERTVKETGRLLHAA